ncbi:pacearchaeosortase [Candidatus Pacearchaeota archaeon]|nr:pacearchaeosortase [Candidatus Pacearchaeota archaeon]
MKKENKKLLLIFSRYIFLVLIALPNLFLFYLVFTPLTVNSVNFFLNFFYSSIIYGSKILVNNTSIEIIQACVAGSAYYLLLLLNLSTPMKARTRIYSIIFSLLVFLLINIARIFIFSMLYLNSFAYFDITHKIFWYVVSGVIVFFVWFATIKIYKIKNIPFYTDIKYIYKLTK